MILHMWLCACVSISVNRTNISRDIDAPVRFYTSLTKGDSFFFYFLFASLYTEPSANRDLHHREKILTWKNVCLHLGRLAMKL